MKHLHSCSGQSGSGAILCMGLITLPQGVVPTKTTDESLRIFDSWDMLLHPTIVTRHTNIMRFIERNYCSNLKRNKTGLRRLHKATGLLDEMPEPGHAGFQAIFHYPLSIPWVQNLFVYLNNRRHYKKRILIQLKAFVYTRYGGPEVLQLKEVDKPSPKDDEVLVKVHAASVNDWDSGLLDGDFINRILNGLRKPKRQILGSDIAGRVEAVGKNVTKFKAGDEVYGDLSGRWGGFAEYTCAPEKMLALKPATMSFVQAAAIPQAAMLAVQGLIDKGKIKAGQKLLINGAGGGVGTFGVQIAKQYGAEVTGVDSTSKLDMMRSIGFDHVIDYTKEDFTKNGKHYDLILDAKTNRSMFDYARALSPNGVYVTVGGSIGRLLQSLFLGPWISMTRKKHFRLVSLKTNKDLVYMNELFEAGKVNPVIDGPYKLEELPEVFKTFAKASHKGKLVVTM